MDAPAGGHPPLVSVIVPAYNCAPFVGQAIRSVLAQDYPWKEIIAVNDGSSDSTLSALKAFGDAMVVLDRPHGGAGAARNAGLRHAKGDYIAFLDGDDVWFPGKLSLQVRYLEEHAHVGLVFTGWTVWAESANGRPGGPACPTRSVLDSSIEPSRSGWVYHRLLLDCILNTSTVLIRRELVRQAGEFDETLRSGQDYDYWLRLSRMAEIHKLAAPLAVYRHHGGNLSQRPKDENYPYLIVTRALARWGARGPDGETAAPGALRRRLATLAFDFAYDHYWRGDPSRARGWLVQCLGHRPLWLRAWLYLAVTLVPRGLLPRGQSRV